MKPIPLLLPNLPTPTTTFNNKAPIAQWYVCPHCNNQSPLVKEWVGLTDEEISNLWCKVSNTDFVTIDTHEFTRAIEAKLKEKNV